MSDVDAPEPKAGLHPVLREILLAPVDPAAIPVERQPPAEARAEFAADIAAIDGAQPTVAEVRDIVVAGATGPLAARLYSPAAAPSRDGPLMIYFHGGGHIRGSIDTHDASTRVLANAAGFPVISCFYRLAPEHPFPAALDDALAASRDIARRAAEWGAAPDRIVVAGDSAGGNVAAALALRARDEDGPAFAAQLLLYPVVDHLAQTASRAAFSSGYLLDSMPFYTASYLPDPARRADPYASPLYAKDLSGLPPAVVLTAGFDPLRDEGLAYAHALAAAGVAVRRLHHPDMIHGFLLFRGLLPEADAALAASAQAVTALIGTGHRAPAATEVAS